MERVVADVVFGPHVEDDSPGRGESPPVNLVVGGGSSVCGCRTRGRPTQMGLEYVTHGFGCR